MMQAAANWNLTQNLQIFYALSMIRLIQYCIFNNTQFSKQHNDPEHSTFNIYKSENGSGGGGSEAEQCVAKIIAGRFQQVLVTVNTSH